MSGLSGNHMPPPDLALLPPHRPVLPSISTDRPSSTAPSAVANPAAPVPTTRTSYSVSKSTKIRPPAYRMHRDPYPDSVARFEGSGWPRGPPERNHGFGGLSRRRGRWLRPRGAGGARAAATVQ